MHNDSLFVLKRMLLCRREYIRAICFISLVGSLFVGYRDAMGKPTITSGMSERDFTGIP